MIAGAANVIPGGSSAGNVIDNGTLKLNGFSQSINGLSGAGTVDGVSGTPTLTVGSRDATSSFTGIIKNTAGTLALTKVGTGTETLSGANTYSGLTTVTAGRLTFQDNHGGGASFVANGILEFNVSGTNTQQLNGGTISGTGTLIKSGTGNLLCGANGSNENINLGAGSLIDVQAGTLRNRV